MSFYNIIDKNILLPVADLVYGSSLASQLKVLKESEFWGEKEIHAFQNIKLRALVEHCYNTVPYYHRLFDSLGLLPKDIQNREDLSKLPILTKQIIRDNYDDLFSTAIDPKHRRYSSTGGSTGTPLKFCMDNREWSMQRASSLRAWESYGIYLGDSFYSLGGNSIAQKANSLKPKNIYDRIIMRNHKFSSAEVDDASMQKHLEEFESIKPKAVRGYGSSLVIFARYMKKIGYRPKGVKAVLTTGEVLMSNYRAELEEVFGVPVYDAYGAGDGGIVSHECVNHKMHITEELCVIEITDREGQVLPDGEVGFVTTTDLNNYVFPFIRYHVGDMSYILKEPCTCGRHTRCFGEIMGRAGKLMYNKQGVPISPTMLPFMLYPDMDYHNPSSIEVYNKIDRFQFRQDKDGNIKVLLKLKDSQEQLSQFDYVVANCKIHFVDSDVVVDIVDDIPTLPSGKEDYCVSEYEYKS